MFAPNQTTFQMADQLHAERQAHATRIHRVAAERSPHSVPVDRTAQRRMTARRLAALTAGAMLSIAVAAGALANQQDPSPAAPLDYSNGGGVKLVR